MDIIQVQYQVLLFPVSLPFSRSIPSFSVNSDRGGEKLPDRYSTGENNLEGPGSRDRLKNYVTPIDLLDFRTLHFWLGPYSSSVLLKERP